MTKVYLKPKKDQFLYRRHPWIFSGAIGKKEGEFSDGAEVEVLSNRGKFLAKGHYHDGSIAVRILSFEQVAFDLDFWRNRLTNARAFRERAGFFPFDETNCLRLVHGEGDLLPGLVIDVYGDTAIIQCHSIGMHLEREKIAQALVDVFPEIKAVYDKSVETLPKLYASDFENGYLIGESAPQVVLENGNSFFVDWEKGQKTGFFLDQRDNRALLAKYAKGKKILNAFCYSGGFSIYALKAGATHVHSVDASAKAIGWTEKNVELNASSGEHVSTVGDVQKFLKECENYDIMVVDPPAFAKKINKRHNAVQAYKRLNAKALQKINPGGMLFTFSCSQVVDRELFYNTIVAAAIEAGRNVRVMHHLTQPPDHPVNLFHPEGAYLKGLVVAVD